MPTNVTFGANLGPIKAKQSSKSQSETANSFSGEQFLREQSEIDRQQGEILSQVRKLQAYADELLNANTGELSSGRRRLLKAFNPGGLARYEASHQKLKTAMVTKVYEQIESLIEEARMLGQPNSIEEKYVDSYLEVAGLITERESRKQFIDNLTQQGHPMTKNPNWGYMADNYIETGSAEFLKPGTITDGQRTPEEVMGDVDFVADNFNPEEILNSPEFSYLNAEQRRLAAKQAKRRVTMEDEEHARSGDDDSDQFRRELLSTARSYQQGVPEVPFQSVVGGQNMFGRLQAVIETRWVSGLTIEQAIIQTGRYVYGLPDEEIVNLFPGLQDKINEPAPRGGVNTPGVVIGSDQIDLLNIKNVGKKGKNYFPTQDGGLDFSGGVTAEEIEAELLRRGGANGGK